MSVNGVAERDEWRANIHRHMDRGTCYLCGKVADPSKGLHGATGAHWACSQALTASAFGAQETGTYVARANGGYRIHIVDAATGRALCGHKPKDTARQMTTRGRWLKYVDQSTEPTCMTCTERANANE